MEIGGRFVEPSDLVDWANSKACALHRDKDRNHKCDNPGACEKNLQTAQILQRLRRFEGTERGGHSVTGYIIED